MLKQNLRQYLSGRTSKMAVLFLIVTGVSATAGAVAWFGPISQVTVIVATSAGITSGPSKISFNQERVEAELITIRPTGFEPAQITRAGGRFVLAVDNRSGFEEVDLQLNRETGSREREALVHRKQLDWREFVDLPPGRYVLKEVNHPDWACLITITRR